MKKFRSCALAVAVRRTLVPASAFLFIPFSGSISAQDEGGNRVLEEVVVQARRQDETLQDVPVTITSVGSDQLDNFQLDQVSEIAERVPNMTVLSGSSGSGGTIILRGVGSSSISAAFDSAVAIDIDGVQIARMRMVQTAYMDLQQVDVLKGPQSLYFGKSASAGVLAFRTADPTEEFEARLGAGYEFEQEGQYLDGYISGPLTDTLGARFAFRYTSTDEFWENSAPNASDPTFGEEDLNFRLTLAWQPSDNFSANFKTTFTDREADYAIGAADIRCIVPGDPQPTSLLGIPFPSGYDCNDDDGVTQLGDPNPVHAVNFDGIENIEPFEELQTNLTRLHLDWNLSENLTLTSVSSYFLLEEEGNDSYGYDLNGFGTGTTTNETESYAQEFRLAGDIGENVSFLLGAFYQDRELLFETAQHVIGAPQLNALLGLPPGDVNTGFTHDWRKVHTTDSETRSLFGSASFRVTDKLELTAGIRYSEEERSQVIEVPELHSTLTNPAFGLAPLFTGITPGFNSGSIDFEDDQWTPEVTALYNLTEDINLFAAYKVGYKAGGIDNSSLPSATLAAAVQTQDFSALTYDSETGEGFEVGVKGRFLNGSLRADVTAFRFVYEDLQVQTFDAQAVQFNTNNAGELVSQGLEADFTWLPSVDGLSVYGAFSLLDAEFTDTFAPEGFDLNGRAVAGAADFAFNAGFDYSREFAGGMEWGLNFNTAYSDGYLTENGLPNPYEQDAYWLLNARAFIGSTDGRWNVAVMGRNLTDELYVVTTTTRPFSVTANNQFLPGGVGQGDQVLNYARGRQLFLQAEFRF
ncbi:MAG: TonB-dependent receptor [Pseudomonadota bacterium]